MSPAYDEVLKQALALTLEERAWLLASVEDSLAEPMSRDIEDSWAAEVDRRVEEAEQGKASFVPWEEVQSRLLAKLHK
ncbi:MAG: addiction module protein [Acidobacteriaceae bacterium]